MVAALLAALPMLAGLAGCGGATVTAGRLDEAVGLSFARLYVLQQDELGHPAAPPDAVATCSRAGTTATTGAGSWTCIVHFPDPDGHVDPLALDVDVQSIGCYTASGPPAVVGGQRLQLPTGRAVTNPLFAFDGCFDPT